MFVEKGQIIQIKGPKLSEVVASSCFNMWERNQFIFPNRIQFFYVSKCRHEE